MASKDLVKGYCKESKCEYDVYTKEKADELLNAKVNISNFAVLTGNVTVPSSSGGTSGTVNTNVNYPTGFTKDNCAPIAIGFKKQNDSDYLYEPSSTNSSGAYVNGYFNGYIKMSSSNVIIYSSNSGSSEINLSYKLVLMKIS